MSEVNPHSPVPASGLVAGTDPVVVSADTSQAPRGEHEDEENDDDPVLTTEGVQGDETPREPPNRPIVETETDESLVAHNNPDLNADEPEAKATTKPKSPVSVKPPPSKPAGGSATPTVKKARV